VRGRRDKGLGTVCILTPTPTPRRLPPSPLLPQVLPVVVHEPGVCAPRVVLHLLPTRRVPGAPSLLPSQLMAGPVPSPAPGAPPVPRAALVIGNCMHTAMTPLASCEQDAVRTARLLASRGYAVTTLLNATRACMEAAVGAVAASTVSGATVLVYFTGYGAALGGVNVVAPVDGDPEANTGEGLPPSPSTPAPPPPPPPCWSRSPLPSSPRRLPSAPSDSPHACCYHFAPHLLVQARGCRWSACWDPCSRSWWWARPLCSWTRTSSRGPTP
jgi:hypothetical protein